MKHTRTQETSTVENTLTGTRARSQYYYCADAPGKSLVMARTHPSYRGHAVWINPGFVMIIHFLCIYTLPSDRGRSQGPDLTFCV